MNNTVLAFIGIAAYVLRVLASASDEVGNPQAPIWLILLAFLVTLFFVVFASIRLWSLAKYTVVVFIIVELLSTVAPFFLTTESSNLNILVNGAGVVSFLVTIYVLYLLFTKPNRDTNGGLA